MPEKTETPLKRIASVSILKVDYDLAQNGKHFHLVEHKEPDAYGRPVAREVELEKWMDVPELQALLDLYGLSLVEIAALQEEVARSHAALQREAGPDSGRRSQVTISRESVTSLPGVLDAEGEGK